jgi:hypothetical protein
MCVASVATANLGLTEVDFVTNTIEITNLSDSPFSGDRLERCIPSTMGCWKMHRLLSRRARPAPVLSHFTCLLRSATTSGFISTGSEVLTTYQRSRPGWHGGPVRRVRDGPTKWSMDLLPGRKIPILYRPLRCRRATPSNSSRVVHHPTPRRPGRLLRQIPGKMGRLCP